MFNLIQISKKKEWLALIFSISGIIILNLITLKEAIAANNHTKFHQNQRNNVWVIDKELIFFIKTKQDESLLYINIFSKNMIRNHHPLTIKVTSYAKLQISYWSTFISGEVFIYVWLYLLTFTFTSRSLFLKLERKRYTHFQIFIKY